MVFIKVFCSALLVLLMVCIVGSGVYHFTDLLNRYSAFTASLVLLTHVIALMIAGSLIRDIWSEG